MLNYLKPRTVGKWTVEHFEITKEEARIYNLRSIMSFTQRRQLDPEHIHACIMPDVAW
jgi:hypothetical protein